MSFISKVVSSTIAIILVMSITACSPEVGSEQWCNQMKETPKGDWSINDASDFTKHCLL